MKVPFALVKNQIFQDICAKLDEVQKENNQLRREPKIPQDAVNVLIDQNESIRLIINTRLLEPDVSEKERNTHNNIKRQMGINPKPPKQD